VGSVVTRKSMVRLQRLVVYRLLIARGLGGTRGPIVEVSLRLLYKDGSHSTRTPYFVYENGEWKPTFGEEENDLFMSDASYEKFVKVQ
jgi:hypothetical protein